MHTYHPETIIHFDDSRDCASPLLIRLHHHSDHLFIVYARRLIEYMATVHVLAFFFIIHM